MRINKIINIEKNGLIFKQCEFQESSLIIGLNNSGKTSILKIIASLFNILYTGDIIYNFNCDIEFEHNGDYILYTYHSDFIEITYESVYYNNKLIFFRLAEHCFDSNECNIGPINSTTSMVFSDKLSHHVLNLLVKWSKQLGGIQSTINITKNIFKYALDKNKDKYKNSLIVDLHILDFDIVDIDFVHVNKLDLNHVNKHSLELYIFKENNKVLYKHLAKSTYNILNLLIYLNYIKFEPDKNFRTILINDICQCLDYKNSKSVINLITNKCLAMGVQLIMNTNNKDVINNVPLSSLIVLQRNKNIITNINYYNSKKEMQKFEEIGLSNFDFFTTIEPI